MKNIEEIYAVISDDGICGAFKNGTWYALVTANKNMIPTFTELATDIALNTNQDVAICKFTQREILQYIKNGKNK